MEAGKATRRAKTKSHSVSSKNDVGCKPGSQALQVVRAKESQHVCEKGLTATAHTEAHLVL